MVRKSVFIFGLLDEGFSTLELIFREWREVVIKGKKKEEKMLTESATCSDTERQRTNLIP